MRRLNVTRLLAAVGALGALGLLAIVPAAAKTPPGKPAGVRSFGIVVCVRPMRPENCGPSAPRVTAGGTSLRSGTIPDLAKNAGTVTVFRISNGKKIFTCPGPCTGDLTSGTRVRIRVVTTQQPNVKYTVDEIVGCQTADKKTCTLTIGSRDTVTVVFASDYGP